MQPPAVGEAKGERQEVSLHCQLVGNEQSALPQQRLAVLNGHIHVSRGVQHIRGKEHVVASQLVILQDISAYFRSLTHAS